MMKFREAPDYANIYTMEKFIKKVRGGRIINYDGIGRLAKVDSNGKIWESKIEVDCDVNWLKEQLSDFTHVCWYNR